MRIQPRIRRTKNKASLFEGPFFYPLQSVWRKTGKQVFACEHGELAFEEKRSSFVVAGDPRAKSLDAQVRTFNKFVEQAKLQRKTVCGYYFSEEFALASEHEAHLCGVSRFQKLNDWSLEGGCAEEARRALSKAKESDLEFVALTQNNFDHWSKAIEETNRAWEKSKGRVEIKFLLSPLAETIHQWKTGSELIYFCVNPQGSVEALVSLRKYFGNSHWYIDSLIQKPGGHKFALDFLMVKSLENLKLIKAEALCIGFCPGIVEGPDTWVEKTLNLWRKTKWLYSPQGLYNFKRKYSNVELPRYLLVDPSSATWKQLLTLEVATLYLRRSVSSVN